MNDLIIKENNLPSTIEDISKFILVGREKLVSIRAEIRAIDKLNLAKDVRDQKKEECSMLAEALLDAEIRIGEFTKQIPRIPGNRTDLKPHITSEPRLSSEIKNPINIKSKNEITKDLGFDQNQVKRFETLANNKDIVEQVKREAKENDDIPTRSRVLDLVKQKKQIEQKKVEEEKEQVRENYSQSQEGKSREKIEQDAEEYKEYCKYIDECKNITYKFSDFLLKCFVIKTDDDTLRKWKEFLKDKDRVTEELESVNIGIPKLLKLQRFLNEELKK